ncbi:MAG: hypothetical protein LBG68_01165 [Coriobacteriales bacterium]|nr:hypothetical protein [Coriobacteriales bacterium]
MTAEAYQALEEQLAEAELLVKIAQAEADIANNRLVDGQAHLAALHEKYDY